MKDPIVEEIRKIRKEIEDEHHNNPDEFAEYILEKQKKSRKSLVTRTPKPLRQKRVA